MTDITPEHIDSLSQDDRDTTGRLYAAARAILDNLPENSSTVLTRLTLWHEPGKLRAQWKDYDPRLCAALVTAAGEWGTRRQGVRLLSSESGDTIIEYASEPADITRLVTRAAELERWQERADRHKPANFKAGVRYKPNIHTTQRTRPTDPRV